MVALLALAALALWLASRLAWSWSRQPTPLHGLVVDREDGSQVRPALVPLALLALASIAAILAIGGWPRRVVGVLVALIGVAAGWLGLTDVPSARPAGFPTVEVLTGHGLAVLGGVFLIVAGVVVIRTANRLPRLGAGYQTPRAARKVRDPDQELWHALSEGHDPTTGD
ncbi:MAG TPA: Trp biosynthesis-associated membrane protein [Pseudonocardiaceae bacterium]|nr:Trp biosynthesis-associated membrane protein [Pseudonocardiaceae bacterium]